MFLEHVNLTVAQIDRSIDFYAKLLGLRLRWRGQTSEGKPAAHIGDERCYLALFQGDPSGQAPSMDYDRVGFNHLGFVIEDLAAAKTRLRDLGVTPHFEPEYAPGRRLYFMDPDGYEVELVQYA
ncbi:MAG TPA: VOC family protein [Planctomycetes bacterium]|nr:VOC family protein [Planctomycetota bacterium]